ncbi:MAG: toll/interleukin-1 receptor domain-containing protein [Chloroflexi bacterium]|nr:toll/interleukin-1 receptor domain-containing protein [Chloroflexota bacterium]MDL1883546.1 toll/interleukin-1 receptor domain-containing protein [Anaerolineae bacterium CFX8]
MLKRKQETMSEKPVIFISHATTDNPIVDILKTQIEQVFAHGIAVFASSVLGVIRPGRSWLDEIKNNLEVARAVIVVVTPVSLNRPWIWFEVGASWSKMESDSRRIFPCSDPQRLDRMLNAVS